MKKQIIYNLYFFIFILSCSSVFSLSQDSALNQDESNNTTDTTTPQYKFSKEIYNQSIPETIKVNTTIIMMNNNHSSLSNLTYTIKNGNENNSFKINNKTGELIVNNNLNYESINNYNLTIEASNNNVNLSTKIMIDIRDIDEAPIIDEIVPIIIDDNNIDKFNDTVLSMIRDGKYCIRTIKAHDPDIKNKFDKQNIIYSIEIPEYQKYYYREYNCYSGKKISPEEFMFNVDKSSGCVTINNPFPNKCVYDLWNSRIEKNNGFVIPTVIVTAYDKNAYYNYKKTQKTIYGKISMSFYCKIWNCPPKESGITNFFKSLFATVNKIEETNIQLLSIITKKDNNKEEENNNNQTKLYTVKLDGSTDFIKISENIKINTTITTSITNTADKNLTYSIKNGNDAGIFTIDNKTGIIMISQSPDFEAKKNHFIVISGDDDADDDRHHVNITLYVKIGDANEAPVFTDVTPLILNTKDVENLNVNDMEMIRNGTYCFRKIIAHDPDITNENDEQHIVYEINGTTIDDIIGIKNSKKCFNNANYYDNYFWNLHDGCLKLKNPFFEKCAFHVLEFLALGQPADYYISSDVIVNAIDNDAIGDYKNTTLILETKITWKFLCRVYGCPPNDIDVEKKTWFQQIIDMFSSIY
ncbi:hypothetical protein HCN44_002328 [Aphidius gifuensis]|uniref:Cadherin domain-containing protein n=1 Tax=Aphidius gifuensis TaxID=684658 RepID=A0A834Y4K5_APHGI|nr:hypothetical protein HCN44_002328 [Aphidius gifuensis]